VTAILSVAAKTKLTKLLGELGSDLAGERDNAAQAAHRKVTSAGLTWRQVINPPECEKKLPEPGTWRQTLAECLARPGSCGHGSGFPSRSAYVPPPFGEATICPQGNLGSGAGSESEMTLQPDIERLALLGWRLHPSSRYSRAACIKSATDIATCDLEQLERWSTEFPGCNWRVVMDGSGIWALDVDAPGPDHAADGIKVLAELVALHGPMPPRPSTRSGGGGFALFFLHRGEPIAGGTGTPAPGLDPRRGRQTVTVPPSIHHRSRHPYPWIVPPWEVPPPRHRHGCYAWSYRRPIRP
jgi:hypothetical protein